MAVAALYAPSGTFDFVNYDDDLCVYQNAHVKAGLTMASVKWAFTSFSLFYWQPLVWLSHMLVCQFFGLNAGPAHLVNAGLHAINAVFLFLLLLSMTRGLWRSAIVAGIFALNPLRVESVAWVTERKDVLSGLAWLVTLWAYYFYTKKTSGWRYVLLLCAFVIGLMTKPVLMTLPVVCLALDYWPLKRWQPDRKAAWSLIREKLPLLFISAASILITLYGLGKMQIIVDLPWSTRLATAAYAYSTYLGRTIWPEHLTLLIPYRLKIPIAEVLLYCLLLLAISCICVAFRKRYPYLFSGWLWFVIVQSPIVGLVQSGPQSIQDHFTYLPSIGILIGIVWLVAEITQPRPAWRFAPATIAVGVMAWFSYQTSQQLQVWRNSISLFTQAAEAAPQSAVVQHNLGFALASEGRYSDAIPRYVLALKLDPTIFQAHYNLGRALYAGGKLPESIDQFRQTLTYPLAPAYEADVRNALGIALTQARDLYEAQNQFGAAHNLEPLSPEINANLGSFLARTGNLEQAATFYRTAIQQSNGFTEAHLNLGRVLMALGRRDQALEQFQIVLLQSPRPARKQAAGSGTSPITTESALAPSKVDGPFVPFSVNRTPTP